MKALVDKVAIVTGASSGIGHATALLFAQEGAKVVANARRKHELDALVTRIRAAGGEAIAVVGDAQHEDVAKSLVATAVTRFGGLDVAFNNVGAAGAMGPITQLGLEAWRETIDTNLTSAFLAAKHQVPALLERGGGSLVFTSSFVGHSAGMPGMAAYAAAKAGLIGLVQVLATEWGAKKIRANAILPGGTDTPATCQCPGRQCGNTHLRGRPARPQTNGGSSGNRTGRALPGLGCVEFRYRYGHAR